ncbi:unnamed protein product [Prorocentrum cordatum]|uniref:EamA domain-containing protein n=1 Tax=Prorocentrum cordatum TaxID=2364126 RepID=A0ABN9U5Z9_9DINO|nr:unnamed protein product [Polarella glacialis]
MRLYSLRWLAIWITSGIFRSVLWELLLLHAGPARGKTNFVSFLGYWGCSWAALLFGVRKLNQPPFQFWRWSWSAIAGMLYLIVNDMVGSSIDYFAHINAGPLLFHIFHSSVVLFVAIFAVSILRASVTVSQWFGIVLVSGSILVTAVPAPLEAPGSFAIGLMAASVSNVFHALQYPVSQRILSSDGIAKPCVEALALFESLLGTIVFTVWTLIYTVPRWHEVVYQPIMESPQPSISWAWFAYLSYIIVEGMHSLSFYFSIQQFGAVPVAVAKGLMISGGLIVVHVLFCGADRTQCITYSHGSATTWSEIQKPVAMVLSVSGVLIYNLCGHNVANFQSPHSNLATARETSHSFCQDGRYLEFIDSAGDGAPRHRQSESGRSGIPQSQL